MDVAAIDRQFEDGIADELARAVISDVAAAAGLEEPHALLRERFRGFEDIRAGVVIAGAERDDGRVFEEQELIRNPPLLSRLDQLPLQIERLLVTDDAEPADFQRRTVNRYSHASSNFSSRSLM